MCLSWKKKPSLKSENLVSITMDEDNPNENGNRERKIYRNVRTIQRKEKEYARNYMSATGRLPTAEVMPKYEYATQVI